MDVNELVNDGYIGALPNGPEVCPVCGGTHYRPWQARANAFFNRRPVWPYEASQVPDVVRSLGLAEDIQAEIIRTWQPDALPVHEAIAHTLEMHMAGRISWDAFRKISNCTTA